MNDALLKCVLSISEHVDFAESTEEIAPLTEEEKKAKLEALRQKLAEKRAGQSTADKEEQRRNEVSMPVTARPPPAPNRQSLTFYQKIRQKSTQEVANIKEELEKKERLKEAAAKRKEKQADIAAKERIRMKIKADQEERRLKAAKEKAEREGRAPPPEPVAEAPAPTASGPVASKPASAYSESRLRLQTPGGNIQKSFPVDTTLYEVAIAVEDEGGIQVQSFTQNYPKKTFSRDIDFGQTLKEAGLVPSAALIVR